MTTHRTTTLHRNPASALRGLIAITAIGLCLTGCATSSSGTREAGASDNRMGDSSQVADASNQPGTSRATTSDSVLVIDPLLADDLGYRVEWRVATAVQNVRMLTAQHDSVFVLDGSNFLSRFRADDGARLWRAPVAEPVAEIVGITYVPDANLVLVMTPGSLLEIDRASGGLVGRQDLAKISNTMPALLGQFLIYGSRNGQVIWHSYPVKFQWRATQVAQSIKVPPVLQDGIAAVVGNGGEVMVLDAERARSVWRTRLLDEVVCEPVISNGVLYIAGLDQHIRAFDIRDGRTLWKVLTKSPLRTSPVVQKNRLYELVPGSGLVCFDALPLDSPGGKKLWTTPDITGPVITRRGADLITWNAETKTLQVIDATYGTLKDTIDLPGAQKLLATSQMDGTLYLISTQGTVTKLVTKN